MRASKKPTPIPLLDTVKVDRSTVHGLGVFARRALRTREVVGEYTGRRYPRDETDPAWDDRLTYLFGLSDGSMIDGAQGGNATRHINHACVPNVEAVERRAKDGSLFLVVRALKRIEPDEELFLDYGLEIDETDSPANFPCACGAETCRGTMVGLTTPPAPKAKR